VAKVNLRRKEDQLELAFLNVVTGCLTAVSVLEQSDPPEEEVVGYGVQEGVGEDSVGLRMSQHCWES
jgi:hypothetical protein